MVKLTPDGEWNDSIPANHWNNFIDEGSSVVGTALLIPDDSIEEEIVDDVDKSWESGENNLESDVLMKSMEMLKIIYTDNWR